MTEENGARPVDEVNAERERKRKKGKLYNHFIPARQHNKYHHFPSSCEYLRTYMKGSVYTRSERLKRGRVGEQKHTFKTIIEFDDNICPLQFYIIYFRYINVEGVEGT